MSDPLTAEQHGAALAVCSIAGRDLDVADPLQRLEAAALAAVPLAALALIGEPEVRRASPAERKQLGSRVVHGTRSAAEQHLEQGTSFCGPCKRWQQVEDRKGARANA